MEVEQRVRMPVESIQITTDNDDVTTELRSASVIRESQINDEMTELRNASVIREVQIDSAIDDDT